MKALKQLGHNALLVEDARGHRSVALGKGLGFATKPGQPVDKSAVEQWFGPTAALPIDRLAALVNDLPMENLLLGVRLTELAMTRLGTSIGPTVAIPLADHLTQVLNRALDPSEQHPLQFEVRQLYPDEFRVAEEAVEMVTRETGVVLPASQTVAIALHLINARFLTEGMQATLRMTATIPELLEVVGKALGIRLDAGSVAVARFVTHLRYLFVRLDQGTQLGSLGDALVSAIPVTHPRAYQVALRLAYLLAARSGQEISADETAYLTLHVARLMADNADRMS